MLNLKAAIILLFFCLSVSSVFAMDKEASNSVTLTSQEKIFIKQHPEIVIGVGKSFDPFVIENQDGSFSGHDIEIAQLVSDRTGLHFKFEAGAWSDISKRAEGREVDGILSAVYDESRVATFNASHSYLSLTSLILVKKGNPKGITRQSDIIGKKVAMQRGNLLFEGVLKQITSDVEIVYYDSIHELLSAVVAGSVDLCILDETAPYLAKKLGLLDFIEVAFPVGKPFELVFQLRKDWPELTSIVNKGLGTVSEKERIKIRDTWFVSTVKRLDYELLGKLVFFMAIAFALMLYWSYTLRVSRRKTEAALAQLEEKDKELEAKNKILEVLSVTDSLTDLCNREKLDSVLDDEIHKAQRYSTEFGVIMIDIDFFKQVNDTYGHQAGDSVLIEMSEILKKYSRRVDTVGRWGGEEFLIICPHTNKTGLLQSAENLRLHIETHCFSIIGNKTASFGAAIYVPDDTNHSLISKADHALYLAKDKGRNRTEVFN